MNAWSSTRTILAAACLLLLLGGMLVGAWNYQQIQSCHAEYDDEPETFVECEDSFTVLVYGVSVFGVVSGGSGVAWILRARGDR